MDRGGYFQAWAALHGGYDPRANPLVRGWLSGVYVLAGPLARAGLAPNAVTVLGVAAAGTATAAAWWGWLLAAALLVVVAGVLDNLDGAVAVLSGRATRWGHLLDSVADRVGDLLFVVALRGAGADASVCVAGGVLMMLQEYVRARAGVAGMSEVGVVTVWERPSRVIVTACFLAAAAVVGDPWAGLGAWAWVGLGLVGSVQLLVVARRRLT